MDHYGHMTVNRRTCLVVVYTRIVDERLLIRPLVPVEYASSVRSPPPAVDEIVVRHGYDAMCRVKLLFSRIRLETGICYGDFVGTGTGHRIRPRRPDIQRAALHHYLAGSDRCTGNSQRACTGLYERFCRTGRHHGAHVTSTRDRGFHSLPASCRQRKRRGKIGSASNQIKRTGKANTICILSGCRPIKQRTDTRLFHSSLAS